jgi:prepilin-type N-terminal cleavage/methylation domain-containing protein
MKICCYCGKEISQPKEVVNPEKDGSFTYKDSCPSCYTERFEKGFTLIELLVVITIFCLLASVVLLSVSSARDKATHKKNPRTFCRQNINHQLCKK